MCRAGRRPIAGQRGPDHALAPRHRSGHARSHGVGDARVITLALDAATYVGTVAVLRDGDVVAARETAMRGRDVERLMPAVADALDAATVRATEIGRIVCGEGPGSFTSLRIAASIAKGLAT